MAVTRDDVAHVAELARIALDESRVDDLVRELNGILSHMDVLRKVDTEGVEPTAGVGDAAGPPGPAPPGGHAVPLPLEMLQ